MLYESLSTTPLQPPNSPITHPKLWNFRVNIRTLPIRYTSKENPRRTCLSRESNTDHFAGKSERNNWAIPIPKVRWLIWLFLKMLPVPLSQSTNTVEIIHSRWMSDKAFCYEIIRFVEFNSFNWLHMWISSSEYMYNVCVGFYICISCGTDWIEFAYRWID